MEEKKEDDSRTKLRVVGCVHPKGLTDRNDDFLLSDKEMDSFVNKVNGVVVYDTHDTNKPVGKVLNSYKDAEMGLMVIIGINNTDIIKKIQNGTYKGLSLGAKYKVDFTKHKVVSKDCNEVSVCKEGDIPGTLIYAHFDKESGGLSKPFGIEWQDVDIVTSIPIPSAPLIPTTTSGSKEPIESTDSGFLKVGETGEFPVVEAFTPFWTNQPRDEKGKWTLLEGKYFLFSFLPFFFKKKIINFIVRLTTPFFFFLSISEKETKLGKETTDPLSKREEEKKLSTMSSTTTEAKHDNPYVPATPAVPPPTTTIPTATVPTTDPTATKLPELSDEFLAQEKAINEAMKAGEFTSKDEMLKYALAKRDEQRAKEKEEKAKQLELYEKVKRGASHFVDKTQTEKWAGIVPTSGAMRSMVEEIVGATSGDKYSTRDLTLMDEAMKEWGMKLKEISEPQQFSSLLKGDSLFKTPISAGASKDSSTSKITEWQKLMNERREIEERGMGKSKRVLFESPTTTVTVSGVAAKDPVDPHGGKKAHLEEETVPPSRDEIFANFFKHTVSAEERFIQEKEGYGYLEKEVDYYSRWNG